MPKFKAEERYAQQAQDLLSKNKKLKHLRVRAYGDTLIIESKDRGDVVKHTRLRRLSVQYWRLEMPSGSRWEIVPGKALLPDLINELVTLYPWMLGVFGSSR